MAKKWKARLGAEKAIELVSTQWFVAVLHGLMAGPRRYSDLQRLMPGISKKMLTQTLRKMEGDGLVGRVIGDEGRVDYHLTDLGESLVGPVQGLCQWAEENYQKVEACREKGERL